MKTVTPEQLDNVLREINDIFSRFDERLTELEKKQNKTTSRAKTTKEEA